MFTRFRHEQNPRRENCDNRSQPHPAVQSEHSGSRREAEFHRFGAWFAFASGVSHVNCRAGAQIARTPINGRSEREYRNWDDWMGSAASLRQQVKA